MLSMWWLILICFLSLINFNSTLKRIAQKPASHRCLFKRNPNSGNVQKKCKRIVYTYDTVELLQLVCGIRD